MFQTACPRCREYAPECTCPGVTQLLKTRRLLREHRKTMRVMEAALLDHEPAWYAFCAQLHVDPSLPQDFDVDADHDPDSGEEDPEKTAKDTTEHLTQELLDKDAFFQMAVVEAARKGIEDRRVLLDLERSRMELEDLKGHMMRQ